MVLSTWNSGELLIASKTLSLPLLPLLTVTHW